MKDNTYVSKVVRSKDQKFDFILYINGKPIVQRWFDIKGFNKKALKSYEMKEMMDELIGNEGSTGIVTEKLKKDSMEYLWRNYNPYYEQEQDEVETQSDYENDNVFRLDVLYNKRRVVSGEFPGHNFPIGKYRKYGGKFQVDITDIIFDMISIIREYLSREDYNTEYNEG